MPVHPQQRDHVPASYLRTKRHRFSGRSVPSATSWARVSLCSNAGPIGASGWDHRNARLQFALAELVGLNVAAFDEEANVVAIVLDGLVTKLEHVHDEEVPGAAEGRGAACLRSPGSRSLQGRSVHGSTGCIRHA